MKSKSRRTDGKDWSELCRVNKQLSAAAQLHHFTASANLRFNFVRRTELQSDNNTDVVIRDFEILSCYDRTVFCSFSILMYIDTQVELATLKID